MTVSSVRYLSFKTCANRGPHVVCSALERLHALKRAGSQVAINAREAVRFLDRITSGKDYISSDAVVLQGPMELYENWEDAEKFFLPEYEEEPEAVDDGVVADSQPPTNKTEDKGKGTMSNGAAQDDLSQMLLSKLNFKKDADATSITSAGTHSGPPSRQSSRSSRSNPDDFHPHITNGESTAKDEPNVNGHQRSASGSFIPTVPAVLRPLLSAILWRLHDGPDAQNAAKGCILLSNDRVTQVWAQKFGIGTKNIHQLRTAIQYEEKEYKNRCKYVEKTQATNTNAEPKALLSSNDDGNDTDEDELVFVPRSRGRGGVANNGGSRNGGNPRKSAAGAKVAPPPPLEPKVEIPTQPIDPDSFSRSLGSPGKQSATDVNSNPRQTRRMGGASRRAGRRGGTRGSSRGGGRGRGKLWVP